MLLARRRVPTASVVQHAHHNTVIGMLLAVLLTLACATPAQAAIDETLSEHEGKSVVIPCPVNKAKCGDLHSINWFKGDDRIAAMLLGDSNVTSVSDEYANRVTVEQNPFRLVINDLKISDEDIYLCDTTFLIPIETCDNFNGYRVELNVLVPPTEVVILDEKGDRIENGSIIGPMQERQTLKVSCVVQNTRPQPQVGWWRGNKRLLTHSASYVETDGLFTATLELNLELSRDDLARDIECRVESAALPNKLINKFRVDLQVRPTSISINGVEHHTVQGSKVVLTCDIHGARPAVNLTWFNSTAVIGPEENDLTEIRTKAFEKDDGTYHTQSELIFNATRFENDMIFRCDADNVVLQINREKPFTSSLTLEVLYPPVVKVSPPEITVNTSDTVLLNCEYVANPASLTQVVWYRNGDLVNVNDTERYEGGNSENVALVIRSTDKEDVGNYTCQLSNAIGKGISEQQIDLDVQFVPIVEVLMIPEGPVKESDESNVTLYCNILEANPALLTKVRWYANSTLLKELPDCEETKEDLCHIDPSKLLLESIGRGFFYNYSCEGYNAAGWGPRSEDKELMVHYEPGPATLTHFPLIAVKKKSVTFSCSVDDPGYPESNRFRWQRGGLGPLQDIVTKDWTVEPVGLDSRTNYSCYAYNEGGKGMMASVNLEVHAPPFFIKNLVPYTGMLHTSRTANLTCRIECVPRCEITWLKGTEPIEKNDTRYFIKEKYMDASPATGDFESMFSVLHFNMSNWPNQKFDIESDSANYTCVSTGNTVGPGIKSATYFSIEYAPENSTVSEEKVYVQEGTIPGRVICNAKANPSAHYSWYFNNTKLGQDQALIINTPMTRNDSGVYTCVASNKHGKSTVETIIDVQFKPRCAIERDEIDDQDTLICTAFGNPVEADFSWSIKAENDSAEWLGSGERRGFADRSYYVLDDDYAIARTYRCVANNTVGPGSFCEFDVAEQLAWWQRWDKTTLIILVASILALLLAVIIICCIIICICRRRRRQDKYRTDVSISATHSVLSYQSNAPQVGVVAPALATVCPQQVTTGCLIPNLAAQELPQLPGPKVPPKSPPPKPPTKITSKPTPTPLHTPTIVTTPTRTPSLRVRHAAQAPKSPPRWPLRPGVMVHVSSDTKQNLATNRMTLRPHTLTAQLSNLTAADSSTASSGTLNASGFSAATAQTTLLNASTQTANSVTTNNVAIDVAGSGDDAAVGLDSVKQTSTLGRLSAKRAAGVGSDEPSASDCTSRTECQTLPHKFSKSAQLQTMAYSNNEDQQHNQILLGNMGQPQTESGCVADSGAPSEDAPTNATETTEQLPVDSAERMEEGAEVCGSVPKRVGARRLGRVEKFLTGIFKRRGPGVDTTRDSQRSHVGLLGGMWQAGAGVLWQRRAEGAETSPFAAEHRLKGIRCSGSVTYKKSPVRTTPSDNAVAACSRSGNCNNNSNNNNNNISISNHTCMSLSTVAPTANASAAELNANAIAPTASNLTTTVTPTAIVAAKAQPPQSPPAMRPLMQPPAYSPRSHASVTFQVPSYDKTAASIPNMATVTNGGNGIASGNNSSSTTPTRGLPQQLHRGILKSPTPPPRPPPPFKAAPPPLQKRNVATVTPTKVERVQIQDKSSSLGDPLTEPGEYENLPFHGLQTAPNKFSTTLTNFNNNTNVVRVAPRPKRLNGNIGPQQHHQLQQQHYEQDQYDQQFQYHQHQQHHQQQQQHQYNTMQYVGAGGRVITTNPQHQQAHTMNSHNKGMLQHHQQQQQQQHMLISAADGASGNVGAGNTDPGGSGYMNGSVGGGAAPHQITYNLNNCFPKSYTEYYHQQQQQKHKNGASNNTSSAQLLNAIEHDYPTYAVVERNSGSASASDMGGLDGHSPRAGHPPTAAAVSTNPFLAISNFKKYDTSGGTSDNAYQPHILDISGSSSMQRSGKRKPMLDGKMEDKKFYSLKFTGGGGKHKTPHVVHKSPASGLLNASMILHGSGSNSSSGGKCKRHHSFAGGSIGDIDSAGPGAQHNAHQVKSSALMRFYDPPAYENLAGDNTAAVQVHECAVEAHPSPAAGGMSGTATILLHPQPTASGSGVSGSHTTAGQTGHKKKHHHRQHQQKDDFNLIEPERLSIYRSDSGISNSSYECVTPVPPPPGSTRTTAILNGTPPPKTPKGNKLAKHASTVSGAPNTGSLVNGINYKKSLRQLGGSKCNIANATASGTSLPVYMNVDGQPAGAFERSCSPSSNLVNSSYESASSSQNDGHGGHGSTDPTSLSSCNSLYSSGTGTLIGVAPLLKTGVGLTAPRCGLHQKPAEITTPEEYEQYQLGHHRHSASSLSVASTVSASGTRRCKKQQNVLAPAGSVTGIEHYAIGVTNPFLASERSATATGCAANAAATADGYSAHGRDKKLRRKTISDPYAHIRYIAYSRSAANNSSNNGAADCQAHAHNYRAQYACNAPKAATATTTTAAAAQQIKLQQQHDNNNSRKHQQHQQSLLIPRKLCANNNKQNEHGDKDDEAVDEHKNKDVAMCQQQRHRLVPLGGNADDRDIVVVTKKTATTEDHMCDNNVTAGLDVSAHAVLPHSEDAQNATSTTTPATYGATGDYLARRPVKLPLRKYHTFHFQPSQTVAGTLRHCKLQQLRIQMQHKQQLENFELPAHHGDEAELTAPSQQPIALIAEARPTRRYAIEGGPLVFRPLSWHEQRTFKPIASPVGAGEAPIEHPTTTRDNAKIPLSEPHREEEEEEKSELSEELADEIKQITRSAQLPHVSLNPAASLEALEALTKHHPELIYATKPGTRQNLHKQLALPERWTQQLDVENRLSTSRTTSQDWTATQSESDVKVDEVAANAALEAPCDDEEDLGYSFCEDDDEDEGVEELVGELVESVSTEGAVVQRTTVSSESPRVVLSAGRNGGHVKYMLRQSYREVHI
ncbi:uncharacterized protein LOC105214792 isoform X2 [Zeugodacus cucurbitae]|nr:uncharacterized protein LOC105214792 isoform X2 [Zeugodacus cucurbitae]